MRFRKEAASLCLSFLPSLIIDTFAEELTPLCHLGNHIISQAKVFCCIDLQSRRLPIVHFRRCDLQNAVFVNCYLDFNFLLALFCRRDATHHVVTQGVVLRGHFRFALS